MDQLSKKAVTFTRIDDVTWRALFIEDGIIVDILECDDANRLADMVLGVICPPDFKIALNAARSKKRIAKV